MWQACVHKKVGEMRETQILEKGTAHSEPKEIQGHLMCSARSSAMDRMAAEIGHALNNHLAVVSGRAELLVFNIKRGEVNRALQSAEIISEQTERMKRLTKILMNACVWDDRKAECKINDLVKDLILFIQPQKRFEGVEFVLKLDEELPTVKIDRDQIQEVLFNLYNNAAEVMAGGRITTRTEYQREGNSVRITVSDTGPGIAEGLERKVFEPGFTTKKGGHGLGLAVCRRIVRDHGGTIQVKSRVGEGTSFVITIPLDGTGMAGKNRL